MPLLVLVPPGIPYFGPQPTPIGYGKVLVNGPRADFGGRRFGLRRSAAGLAVGGRGDAGERVRFGVAGEQQAHSGSVAASRGDRSSC